MRTLDNVLCADIWSILAPMLSITDTGAVACTCREWNKVISSPAIDSLVARAYAIRVLRDEMFWEKASLRPASTRQELSTYRMEIRRIEKCKRAAGIKSLVADELYKLWTVIDGPAGQEL